MALLKFVEQPDDHFNSWKIDAVTCAQLLDATEHPNSFFVKKHSSTSLHQRRNQTMLDVNRNRAARNLCQPLSDFDAVNGIRIGLKDTQRLVFRLFSHTLTFLSRIK